MGNDEKTFYPSQHKKKKTKKRDKKGVDKKTFISFQHKEKWKEEERREKKRLKTRGPKLKIIMKNKLINKMKMKIKSNSILLLYML